MKRLSKIQEEQPEALQDASIVDLVEQADLAHDLKVLYDTEGGKALVKLLIKDIKYNLQRLVNTYKSATHVELITTIASIDASLTTAKLLIDSKDVVAILDAELDEALRE